MGRSIPFIPLIETALGLARLPEILAVEQVAVVAFGSLDFSLDIGCAHERMALLAVRGELVWRSRAAGRVAPLDGVTINLDQLERTTEDARHAFELGFGGKLAVHPRQVDPIRSAFRPSADSVAWARNILARASSAEAVRVDGEMIDAPLIDRARRILLQFENTA